MLSIAFFDTPERQSIIKTKLVSNYFSAWSTIMLRQSPAQIAYVDLFSGPGVFADGTPSTPLWILRYAIKNKKLSSRLVTVFNDKDHEFAEQLQKAIDSQPGIELLTYRPQVSNIEVGNNVVDMVSGVTRIPTLFFIDPWGYKGLSLDLIGASIKNWGCECIFFFNYNRILPGINNPSVAKLVAELFGTERFEQLRDQVNQLPAREKEPAIISAITESLKKVGGRYVLPFGIKSQHGERTSHYIIFVSKHFRGYDIMKEVMAGLSSDDSDVKNFEYAPVKSPQLRLLDPENPHSIPALKQILLRMCAGKTMKVDEAYEYSTVDTPYTSSHVKKAIIELEAEGWVTVDKPAAKRKRKGLVTLGDDRFVAFRA